jgi:hypothetical protein
VVADGEACLAAADDDDFVRWAHGIQSLVQATARKRSR